MKYLKETLQICITIGYLILVNKLTGLRAHITQDFLNQRRRSYLISMNIQYCENCSFKTIFFNWINYIT